MAKYQLPGGIEYDIPDKYLQLVLEGLKFSPGTSSPEYINWINQMKDAGINPAVATSNAGRGLLDWIQKGSDPNAAISYATVDSTPYSGTKTNTEAITQSAPQQVTVVPEPKPVTPPPPEPPTPQVVAPEPQVNIHPPQPEPPRPPVDSPPPAPETTTPDWRQMYEDLAAQGRNTTAQNPLGDQARQIPSNGTQPYTPPGNLPDPYNNYRMENQNPSNLGFGNGQPYSPPAWNAPQWPQSPFGNTNSYLQSGWGGYNPPGQMFPSAESLNQPSDRQRQPGDGGGTYPTGPTLAGSGNNSSTMLAGDNGGQQTMLAAGGGNDPANSGGRQRHRTGGTPVDGGGGVGGDGVTQVGSGIYEKDGIYYNIRGQQVGTVDGGVTNPNYSERPFWGGGIDSLYGDTNSMGNYRPSGGGAAGNVDKSFWGWAGELGGVLGGQSGFEKPILPDYYPTMLVDPYMNRALGQQGNMDNTMNTLMQTLMNNPFMAQGGQQPWFNPQSSYMPSSYQNSNLLDTISGQPGYSNAFDLLNPQARQGLFNPNGDTAAQDNAAAAAGRDPYTERLLSDFVTRNPNIFSNDQIAGAAQTSPNLDTSGLGGLYSNLLNLVQGDISNAGGAQQTDAQGNPLPADNSTNTGLRSNITEAANFLSSGAQDYRNLMLEQTTSRMNNERDKALQRVDQVYSMNEGFQSPEHIKARADIEDKYAMALGDAERGATISAMEMQSQSLPQLSNAYSQLSASDMNRIQAGLGLLTTPSNMQNQDFGNMITANQASGQATDQSLNRLLSAIQTDASLTDADRQYMMELAKNNQGSVQDLFGLNTQERNYWTQLGNQNFGNQAQQYGINQGTYNQNYGQYQDLLQNLGSAYGMQNQGYGQDLQTALSTMMYGPQLLMDLGSMFQGRDASRSASTAQLLGTIFGAASTGLSSMGGGGVPTAAAIA